jgi:hypothetical protein
LGLITTESRPCETTHDHLTGGVTVVLAANPGVWASAISSRAAPKVPTQVIEKAGALSIIANYYRQPCQTAAYQLPSTSTEPAKQPAGELTPTTTDSPAKQRAASELTPIIASVCKTAN